MITMDVIKQAANRVVAATNPLKIILFGSYATGTATEDSDVDLVIITSGKGNRWEEMARLREVVGEIGTGVDLLVYSPEEFNKRLDWCTSPIYWASREGVVLHDTSP